MPPKTRNSLPKDQARSREAWLSHSLLSMETKRTILQLLSMCPRSAFGSSKSEANPSCPLQLLGQHRQNARAGGTLGAHTSIPPCVARGCGHCTSEQLDSVSLSSSVWQDLSCAVSARDLTPELGLDPGLQPPHSLPLVTTVGRDGSNSSCVRSPETACTEREAPAGPVWDVSALFQSHLYPHPSA